MILRLTTASMCRSDSIACSGYTNFQPKVSHFRIIFQIASMVGDVNIFINDSTGELTTMIAESKWRRKGLGEEAVRIMLWFAFQVIGLRVFEVKISKDNVNSLKLFQKIGFTMTSQCSKFHEYTLSIVAEHILEAISHLEVTVDKY